MKQEILNHKIYMKSYDMDDARKILIHVHGYGENKDVLGLPMSYLKEKHVGVISFDLPGHGEDKSSYDMFTRDVCISYLKTVIDDVKTKYVDVPIVLSGASFGGYLVLSYIDRYDEVFDTVLLRYPAVNFFECTNRTLQLPEGIFNRVPYVESPGGYRLYKEVYESYRGFDLGKNFHKHGNHIFVIQGDEDITVRLEDVEVFCKMHEISLQVVPHGRHTLRGFEKVTDQFFIEHIR